MSTQNFRLYTFVAGRVLSELQRGLQTAHVVGEMHSQYRGAGPACAVLDTWAHEDKTIIILNAHNHKGVLEAHKAIQYYMAGPLKARLPFAIFFEDEDSMNNMATACGIILPEEFYDVTYEKGVQTRDFEVALDYYLFSPKNPDKELVMYKQGSPEFDFIKFIKGFRSA